MKLLHIEHIVHIVHIVGKSRIVHNACNVVTCTPCMHVPSPLHSVCEQVVEVVYPATKKDISKRRKEQVTQTPAHSPLIHTVLLQLTQCCGS